MKHMKPLAVVLFALAVFVPGAFPAAPESQEERLMEFIGVEIEMAAIEEEIAAIEKALAAELFIDHDYGWRGYSRSDFRRYINDSRRESRRGTFTEKQLDYVMEMYAAESEMNKKYFSQKLWKLERKLSVLRSVSQHLETLMAEGSEGPAKPSGLITVVWATYGGNCREKTCTFKGKSQTNTVREGNVTGHTAGKCNGKSTCEYVVDYFDPKTFLSNGVVSDPCIGCVKDFEVEWHCGDPDVRKNAKTGGGKTDAGLGSSVTLTCD